MTISAITNLSFSSWAAFANHLWQSTLLAGVAGLLALALKENRAQARYWLWLAASMKFLIPFSLLVSAGNHWGWTKARVTQPGFMVVIEDISRPFSPAQAGSANANVFSTTLAKVLHLLPDLLLVAWFFGFVAVLFFWCLRWRRLTAALNRSETPTSGRELEMLRRLSARAGIARGIDFVLSATALEPGIVGIFRPVLLLPEAISDRLTDAQLEAIMTHELCHVRRRDNLAAALHMLVEALFWFHPLIWWIGARLVDERERACDQEVLRLGSEPQVYAEGILKVCEFYLETPLVCVAGVTGSNLKKRIEEIMIHRIARKLGAGRKLLLVTVGAATLAGPIVFGLFHATPGRAQQIQSAPPPGFETVMIRPNKTGEAMPPFHIISDSPSVPILGVRMGPEGFAATNATLRNLIRWAYGVQDNQISGGPAWINTERYDVDTKYTTSIPDDSPLRSLPDNGPHALDQRRLMVHLLLADRFKLAVHHEVKELPADLLLVGPNGSKLNEVQVQPDSIVQSRFLESKNQLVGRQTNLSGLVRSLSQRTGSLVIDETKLKGLYDFTFDWPPQSPDSQAALVTALREQLGLELRQQTALVDTIIVDHAEPIAGDQP
jgi:bla regulator protein BlaR1